MRIALIAAVAENGVIGRDGALPWRLSGDLRHFKALTLGKPVVMGRKTWESLGRPLPGRPNIVVSRDAAFAPDGAEAARDPAAALDRARALAGAAGADEIMVIGGAALYEAALPEADRLYLTEVHAAVAGDTHFPPLDRGEWRETSRERREAGEKDEHAHSFVVFDRVGRK